MTILSIFLINQIRTGGDKDFIELLELLAKRGNKVIVFLNSCLDYEPKYFNAIYLTINYRRHRGLPTSYKFKKYIKENIFLFNEYFPGYTPDIIHIHGDIYLKAAIYLKKFFSIPLFYASRLNNISRVITLRKYKAYTLKEYFLSLIHLPINRHREKQIAKYAELICFLNSSDRDIFLSRTKRINKNIVIIPNNINTDIYTKDSKNKNKSEIVSKILYVGKLGPHKGVIDLVKAAAILKKEGFELTYHLLGRKKKEKRTFALIRKLGLTNNIIVEGFTNPISFYINCDLFVYPTYYDDFGNVITESLHCGCPVISTKSTGPMYILEYEELLFNLGSPEEIAAKIKRCVTDIDYYKRIRFLCQKRVQYFYFDWAERFDTAIKDYLRGTYN